MATKTTTRKTTSATKESAAKDYTYLADKEPTDLHIRMAKWMTEQTGVEITPKQAQIVAVLRMEYQASSENQEALKRQKAEAEAKEEARKTAARDRLMKQAAKLGVTITEA